MGGGEVSPEVEQEFMRMWAEGVPISDMAEALSYSGSYLQHYAHHHRERFPSRLERVPAEAKREALERVDSGESMYRVAKDLGIAWQTIQYWRTK